MDLFTIDECLKSMIILYDTREQPTERAQKRYDSFGCSAVRQHLDYGDYSFNFLLNNEYFYPMGEDVAVKPKISIERKSSLEELSHNLIQDKQTFEAEFQRAKDNDARMYLLIEDGNMEKIYSGKYKTRVHPNAYKSSLWAITARYGLSAPVFCKKELSGKVIYDILYRELKNLLECGFYG